MRNSKGSDILSYLEITQLICPPFKEAGERHKISRSETKDLSLFTAKEVTRLTAFFWCASYFSPSSHREICKGTGGASLTEGFITGEK